MQANNVVVLHPSSETDGTKLFLPLADLGYSPIPIVPHNQTFLDDGVPRPGGKTPGVYASGWCGMRGWQNFLHERPSAVRLEMWSHWNTAGVPGVGIVTGQVIAIDLDITHQALANAVLNAAQRILGRTPFIRYGNAPKAILVYRSADETITKRKSPLYTLPEHDKQAVEILGAGQQFVAYGVHPTTKQPYHWPNASLLDCPAADLPPVTLEAIGLFLEEFEMLAEMFGGEATTAAVDTGDHVSSIAADIKGHVADAINAIKNEELHYDDWVRVGMALKGALSDDEPTANALWHEFSGKSAKYQPSYAQARWDSFHPKSIGAGTLYHLAEKDGFIPPLPDPGAEFSAVELDASDAPTANPNKRPALYYKKPSDITPALDHVALVENYLDQGAMSVLYGESNTGKTFVAMDIAYHIASGKEWNGHRVTQGAVLYVAAEGGKSAENRIEALKRHFGTPDFPLYLVPCSVDLLRPDADTKPLIQLLQQATTAEGVTIRMIVVDTLSRAIAGGNENSPDDMGAFVRNVDRVRSAANAHLMVVHHSGKDKAKGARGHSLLRAATDTEIEIADGTLAVTKQRDMEMTKPSAFELKQIDLGKNHYNKPVTSCVVTIREAAATFTNDFALEPRDAVVLNAFHDAIADAVRLSDGKKCVSVAEWMEACLAFDGNRVPGFNGWTVDKANFPKVFRRCRDRLSALGFVVQSTKFHWVMPD